MKNFKSLLTALTLFVCSSGAPASLGAGADEVHEAHTGRTFAHELTGGTDSVFTFAGGSTTVGAALGYRYYLLPDYGIQVGYDTNFQYTTAAGNGVTSWNNAFGIRYNFFQTGLPMLNQLFIDAGVGFQLNHSSFGQLTSSNSDFLFRAGVGKRFALFENVAWVPEISETDVASQGWALTIVPIAVSIFFRAS